MKFINSILTLTLLLSLNIDCSEDSPRHVRTLSDQTMQQITLLHQELTEKTTDIMSEKDAEKVSELEEEIEQLLKRKEALENK
ncbi:MAG: hypothetical protein P4L22_05180 [Candidatus Babeliales bacterium]|nr:hypothetical protein [Candidatus Babeliales bacterium]